MLASQGFHLPPDKAFWWGVHLERFLAFARKRGENIPLDALASEFLEFLRQDQPPPPTWRMQQIRLALGVFRRGIENWHWEGNERGVRTARFRLKCSVQAPVGAAGESRQRPDVAPQDLFPEMSAAPSPAPGEAGTAPSIPVDAAPAHTAPCFGPNTS